MKTKPKIALFIILALLCGGAVASSVATHSDIMQCISLVAAVLGVVLLGVELYQSRKITEADFLAQLNTSFVTNEDYKTAYTLFENYDFENCPDLTVENCFISNYLTFFEVFQLLIDKGTLTIKMVNDLFGYRFFIAVHNPYVQKQKLTKSPENFKNLYKLEYEWVKYRRKNNLPVFHEEYCLENVVDREIYDSIISRRKIIGK